MADGPCGVLRADDPCGRQANKGKIGQARKKKRTALRASVHRAFGGLGNQAGEARKADARDRRPYTEHLVVWGIRQARQERRTHHVASVHRVFG